MARRILYALLSTLLLSVPWLGGSGLTLLVAFVPLLMLQQSLEGQTGPKGKPRRLWPYLALTFSLWWLATTFWVGYAAWIGIVAAVIIGTLLNTAVWLIYHAAWKRAKRPLAYTLLVTAWIGYEYLYTVGEISFPWLTLGNGFAGDVRLVQWYEYTGVFGGSLWVLVCNLLIFEAIKAWKRWASWIAPALWVLIPAALSLTIYHRYEIPRETAGVTVLQPNLDPYREKFSLADNQINTLLLKLTAEAPRDIDFIVAPETALPDYPREDMLLLSSSVRNLQAYIRTYSPRSTLVCGASTYRIYPSRAEATPTARASDEGYWFDYFNSALAIDSTDSVAVHHKAVLVAGVEKMPYYSLLKYLDFLIVELGGISGQLGAGTPGKVFTTPEGIRYGTAICYESIYGAYFAKFIRNGARLMFVITNDGWWGDTPGYRNHFAYGRLRAIETRRSVVRSANTGISGFINPRGDVGQTLGWDVRGTLTGTASLNDTITYYVRYGDQIARLCVYVFILGLLYFMAYRVRKKFHIVD